jgi:2-amino-4-hydroxy-6-hydroxymethyldihydropteridine diphosphokinase
MKNRAVIALGSNIRPEIHIPNAILRLQHRTRIVSKSDWVATKPVGDEDQPDFINGVVLVETEFERAELEKWLHEVEAELGRVRNQDRFGPRTIDMDVAVWNGEIVHPDVREREFLKKAVCDVLPELKKLF